MELPNQELLKALENLRRDNKQDIRDSQIEAFREINKLSSDFNKYLFTFTTLFISLVFSIFGFTDFLEKITAGERFAILEALLFFLMSMMFGFMHIVSNIGFHKQWLVNTEERLQIWSTTSFFPGVVHNFEKYLDEYDSMKVNAEDLSKELKKESSKLYIVIQAMLWFIGLIHIIWVILNALWK